MSAEAGTEPEAPKRRGRIPQSAWPHILERHRAGATLSAIAREFDCTPSAISYIVRKAEASGIEPAAAPAAEPAESSETSDRKRSRTRLSEPVDAEPRRSRISRKRLSSAAEPAVEASAAAVCATRRGAAGRRGTGAGTASGAQALRSAGRAAATARFRPGTRIGSGCRPRARSGSGSTGTGRSSPRSGGSGSGRRHGSGSSRNGSDRPAGARSSGGCRRRAVA